MGNLCVGNDNQFTRESLAEGYDAQMTRRSPRFTYSRQGGAVNHMGFDKDEMRSRDSSFNNRY